MGDDIPLEAKGRGAVRLQCLLPGGNGESHEVELQNVLKWGHSMMVEVRILFTSWVVWKMTSDFNCFRSWWLTCMLSLRGSMYSFTLVTHWCDFNRIFAVG